MSLQIRKLTGPDELHREHITTPGSQATSVASIADENAAGVFTCFFSRNVRATDYPVPTTAGEVPAINITISVYDNNGTFINRMTLAATQANIRTDRNLGHRICFRLCMSERDFGRLTGGNFYIHANLTIAGENITFRQTFTHNYHETIKHIHIYEEQRIDSVLWSTQCSIPATDNSEVRQTIGLNEEAYIHIRTRGLWCKPIRLRFYVTIQGVGIEVASIEAPLYQNRKVVTVSMKYLFSCYCTVTNRTYNENEEIDLDFEVQANYEIGPVFLRSGFIINEENAWGWTNNLLERRSGVLNLSSTIQDFPTNLQRGGNVYVRVNNGSVGTIGNDRYRDFLIGFMCHVEGIGKLINYHDNTSDDNPRLTIYPLHAYSIMLSDMVACGLVSLEEAIYLTTVDHDMQTLRTRANLEANFNKTNAPLNGDTPAKQLISIFQDNSYRSGNNNQIVHTFTNRANIRKLLAQVRAVHTDALQEQGRGNMRYVCRDAWQKVSKSPASNTITRVHRRTDATRYSYAKECPFGEFFITYNTGTNYMTYVSHTPGSNNIGVYNQTQFHPQSPNQIERGGIAFHKGGAGFSIGCITFNMLYNGGAYVEFDNVIYPEGRRTNNAMLNFVCIDERHAVGLNPDSERYTGATRTVTENGRTRTIITNGETINFYRYYDLIAPDDRIERRMYLNGAAQNNNQNNNQENNRNNNHNNNRN